VVILFKTIDYLIIKIIIKMTLCLNSDRMKFLILTIFSLLIVSIIVVPEASAENPNLFVSAENSQNKNTFSGPMVIEVKIIDNDIFAIDKAWAEPNVTINGTTLKMIQATDGHWYGYFADKTMAETADATTSINGKGLDFGGICTVDKARDALFYSSDPTFFNDVSAVATSDPLCGSTFNQTNINVLRKAEQANNNNPVNIGQQNMVSTEAWPFIQLFDFKPTSNLTIQYNKKTEQPQTVNLTFDTPKPENINLKLKGDAIFTPNSHVLLTINDLQLNIDPTDEDSWTWETTAPGGLFYKIFDEDGHLNAGGASEAIDVLPFLSDLMFEDDKRLILDRFDEDFPTVVHFHNNTIQKTVTPNDIVGSQPITFQESKVSSGIFNNFVDFKESNLVVSSEAVGGSAAWIKYNNVWHGILIFEDKDNDGVTVEGGDCNDLIASINPEAQEIPDNGVDENCDGFDVIMDWNSDMFWNKPEYLGNETATLTIKNEIMNKNSKLKDVIDVKIHSRLNPEGIGLKVKETKIDSGIFKGSITLYNLQSNLCFPNKDNLLDTLCVFDEDRVYASFSYPNINDVITSSTAKSTVSTFHNETKDLRIGDLTINFTKPSDYYFTAIEQLEEKLEANNFTSNQYHITTNVRESNYEVVISQTITIDIANRTEYDKIFDYNKLKNFTNMEGANIKENIMEKLNECKENNIEECDKKTTSILSAIDSQIGQHYFTESIFYQIKHDDRNSAKLTPNLTSEKYSIPGDVQKQPLTDWAASFPFFQFLNFDLIKQMIPNAMAISKTDDKSSLHEFPFINGFSYGFGFGKSFEYEYAPEGFDDFFSTEARFAFGLGLGLRIPVNMTVTTNSDFNLDLTNNTKNISFTVNTLDLNPGEYEHLGLRSYQDFEGHEFAAYLGPEIHATAGIFEDGPFYEYEKELPKPSSEHFTPPLGEEPVEFTNFDISISDFIPYLDFAKFFFTVDAYAGFNGDLEGNQIKMDIIKRDIISSENSTKSPLIFEKNNETKLTPYPEKSSVFTIGNLTYDSSLNFKPKIGGEAYFMGITILSEEIELGNLALSNIVLYPHPNTASTYNFLVNGTSDGFYKGVLDVEGHQVHYLSSVGPISEGSIHQEPESRSAGQIPEGSIYNQTNSLGLAIDAVNDGQLSITLPRELIDAKIGDDDDDFLVLVDGAEVNYDETISSKNRNLVISFPAGTKKIEISETHVVPEFGIMTMVILGATLTSIMTLTFRSKLIIRF
jgi:predicted secreted protein with PEFG-CTERM motif